jgi:RNA polymerase sigma factor (TIGR02999 family)
MASYNERHMSTAGDVTRLLQRVKAGDPHAAEELVPLVYEELRRLARHYMRRERPGHLLQTTALVNEAYIRMAALQSDIHDRSHFFALAAQQMRRILVDHAREQLSQKRGAGTRPLELNEEIMTLGQPPETIRALDEALEDLAKLDQRQARIVEMRFFAGLTEEEIALVMGLSSRTIKRDWIMAKSWLLMRLK